MRGIQLTVALIVAFALQPVTPADAGLRRPPHLGPIIAIFAPPDRQRPVADWCAGQVTVPKNDDDFDDLRRKYPPLLNAERCTTYYFVRIPEEVGTKKLEVEWTLKDNTCGDFKTRNVYDRYRSDDHIAYASWFHPHPAQHTDVKTPCPDEAPHSGTIIVDVVSPKWVCTAKYVKGSNGSELPDFHGNSSATPPRRCTPNR